MSSNRISCLIALYKTCFCLHVTWLKVAVVGWLSGLCPSCVVLWVALVTMWHAQARRICPLHVQNWSSLNYLNIEAFTELMTHCKIEAVQWIRTRGTSYVITYDTYIYGYIDRSWGFCLISMGLAQTRFKYLMQRQSTLWALPMSICCWRSCIIVVFSHN